jgi:hypothetical protein
MKARTGRAWEIQPKLESNTFAKLRLCWRLAADFRLGAEYTL